MHKIVGILLVLSFLGLLQAEAFARRTPNQIAEFIKKREQIKCGTLTYRFRHQPYNESDTQENTITVRFFDVKRGPYNYIYTAVIAEDMYGNILIYDFDSTYKFATHLKRKKVSPYKNFNHEGEYFYEPFSQYNGMANWVTNDTLFRPVIKDSVFGNSPIQIIESKKYSANRYFFDTKTSLPIYHQQVWFDSYKDYTLLDYKLNNFDSAAFFRMLADSVKSLLVSSPNPSSPNEQVSLYQMPPLRDTVAPDFTYRSFTGDTVQLSKMLEEKKVVIVGFWVKSELARGGLGKDGVGVLTSLYTTYKDRGLEILGLNPFDKRRVDVDSAVTAYGITYPVLFANRTAMKKYRINDFSNIFVISNGKIVYTHDRNSSDLKGNLTVILEKYLTN